MLQRTFALAVALGMLGVPPGLWAQEKEKASKSDEAKKVSEQFTKALVMDTNLKEVMKLVGVPSLWRGDESVKVIRKMEDLKEEYDILMNREKPYKGKLKFVSIDSVEAVAATLKVPEAVKKKVDEVLQNYDRVVKWKIDGADGGFVEATVFVAWRDGQAKVVFFTLAAAEPSTDKKKDSK
jgi:hypothetical protein